MSDVFGHSVPVSGHACDQLLVGLAVEGKTALSYYQIELFQFLAVFSASMALYVIPQG